MLCDSECIPGFLIASNCLKYFGARWLRMSAVFLVAKNPQIPIQSWPASVSSGMSISMTTKCKYRLVLFFSGQAARQGDEICEVPGFQEHQVLIYVAQNGILLYLDTL